MKKIIDAVLSYTKWLFWSKQFGSTKGRIYIGKSITFQNPSVLHFGTGVGIGDYSYFLPITKYAGSVYSPKISIGDNCWIGIRNSFACIHSIEIGNNVLFAGYVHITDHSHGYEDIEKPIANQPLISKGGIVIEDQCWLGFGCEILSGVHIGRHSIIAARAVVTKDVPAYSVVAGNPARVIKQYDPDTQQWKRCQ